MQVQVILFARAAELAGTSAVQIELPAGAVVQQLLERLCLTCPALTPIAPSLHVALDGAYALPGDVVQPQQEVACFPPVSGG